MHARVAPRQLIATANELMQQDWLQSSRVVEETWRRMERADDVERGPGRRRGDLPSCYAVFLAVALDAGTSDGADDFRALQILRCIPAPTRRSRAGSVLAAAVVIAATMTAGAMALQSTQTSLGVVSPLRVAGIEVIMIGGLFLAASIMSYPRERIRLYRLIMNLPKRATLIDAYDLPGTMGRLQRVLLPRPEQLTRRLFPRTLHGAADDMVKLRSEGVPEEATQKHADEPPPEIGDGPAPLHRKP
jgi:hypothetical protein